MAEGIHSRDMQIEQITTPSEHFVKGLIERFELNAYEMLLPENDFGSSGFGLPPVQSEKARIYGNILESVLIALGQEKIIDEIKAVANVRIRREIEDWDSKHGR